MDREEGRGGLVAAEQRREAERDERRRAVERARHRAPEVVAAERESQRKGVRANVFGQEVRELLWLHEERVRACVVKYHLVDANELITEPVQDTFWCRSLDFSWHTSATWILNRTTPKSQFDNFHSISSTQLGGYVGSRR